MDELVFSFEHESGYHDFGLGGTHWQSLNLANHQDPSTDFSNFGILGHHTFNPYQQRVRQMLDPALDDPMNKIETYPHMPFIGPRCLDTAYDHGQLSSQQELGPQPVSMQANSNSANNDSYSKFYGVFSPEKLSPTRSNRSTDSACYCPRCNKGFTRRTGVKYHFPQCIKMHDNPYRLRCDDHVSLKPLRKGETRDEPLSHVFRGG